MKLFPFLLYIYIVINDITSNHKLNNSENLYRNFPNVVCVGIGVSGKQTSSHHWLFFSDKCASQVQNTMQRSKCTCTCSPSSSPDRATNTQPSPHSLTRTSSYSCIEYSLLWWYQSIIASESRHKQPEANSFSKVLSSTSSRV
jgi:hypothetical protein